MTSNSATKTATVAAIVEVRSIPEFLFNGPLYAEYGIENETLITLISGTYKIDGYCVGCGKSSTFRCTSNLFDTGKARIRAGSFVRDEVVLECTRGEHEYRFWIECDRTRKLKKIGQRPSLADIANDESSRYRKILGPHDAAEFHKAIGLAAHGVGIGAFVYLRRIFERLINDRFNAFKDAEGWTDEQFNRCRMDGKIELLKGHLPDFLVRNRTIYGILSQGIHELEDAKCLEYFNVIKSSIVVILEEDKRKQEDLARQAELEKALKDLT